MLFTSVLPCCNLTLNVPGVTLSGELMAEQQKETVIVIHGTWASPTKDAIAWYERPPPLSDHANFVTKLDACLEANGSSARCWAHCRDGAEPFTWTGFNSWLDRTEAANALANYVERLRAKGWICHIVAHSHGGNVVIGALPVLVRSTRADLRERIVTLGTPFLDVMAPIDQRREVERRLLFVVSSASILVLLVKILRDVTESYSSQLLASGIAGQSALVWAMILVLANVFSWLYRMPARRREKSYQAMHLSLQKLQILSISSPQDEAWQVLHHLRILDSPVSPRLPLLQHLRGWRRAYIEQSKQIDKSHGLKAMGDCPPTQLVLLLALQAALALGTAVAGLSYLMPGTFTFSTEQALVILANAVLVAIWAGGWFGMRFVSALISPLRVFVRHAKLYFAAVGEVATYYVRRRVWPVIQAMALGLEGYRFDFPSVERYPPTSHTYEDLPNQVLSAVLLRRAKMAGKNLGSVTDVFSNAVVTAADINHLLDQIGKDASLVHAAYYTDDLCIKRIADWIVKQQGVGMAELDPAAREGHQMARPS